MYLETARYKKVTFMNFFTRRFKWIPPIIHDKNGQQLEIKTNKTGPRQLVILHYRYMLLDFKHNRRIKINLIAKKGLRIK